MLDTILAAIISGVFIIVAALITIFFGSKIVAKKIRTQKKYDKLIEFQELASPVSTAMLSQANDIIRRGRTAVDGFNKNTLKQRDRYGVKRKFWEIHVIYKPLIPEDLWEAYGNLGKAFEKINHEYGPKAFIDEEVNKKAAEEFLGVHKIFTEKLKEKLAV